MNSGGTVQIVTVNDTRTGPPNETAEMFMNPGLILLPRGTCIPDVHKLSIFWANQVNEVCPGRGLAAGQDRTY